MRSPDVLEVADLDSAPLWETLAVAKAAGIHEIPVSVEVLSQLIARVELLQEQVSAFRQTIEEHAC